MKVSFRVIQTVVVLTVVAVLGLSYGCAKPPTKEMADAEAALTAAKLAEADIYVPNEYRSAEEMLAQAQAEIQTKEYGLAKNSAIQTIGIAEQAKEHAISAKAAAKIEAAGIMAELKTTLEEAEAAQALKYNASAYNRLLKISDEIGADFEAEKYLDVIAKGRTAIAEARELASSSRLAAAEEARRKAEEEVRRKTAENARRLAAEEARLRAEEEARRLAEELARAKPPSHIVTAGECLWVISEKEKIYDNPFQWPLIYKANRSQIRDPDLIFPGQDFKIPRNVSEGEVKEAAYMAKNRGPWSLYDGK